jgi:tellurium resistance protein TerD
MKLKLYNAEVEITQERTEYGNVRSYFEELPDIAVDLFVTAYRECGDCHRFADIGYAKGQQVFAAAADVGVNYLIERGFYDLTPEIFFQQYLAPYLTWHAAFSEWDDAYGRIIEEGVDMQAHRQHRLENRSRLAGGGFGIQGAVKGIALAGAANAAWGMAHGLRNAIGSASAHAAQQKQLTWLFDDEQNKAFLANAIRSGASAVHVAVFEFIAQNDDGVMPDFLCDVDKVERAIRLKKNLIDGRIPLSQAPDVVPEILEGNPYAEDRYLLALAVLGDPDNHLQLYGNFHDIDVLKMKLQQINEEIDPLFRAPQFSSAEAAEKVKELAIRLGCIDDDEITALLEKIDQKDKLTDEHRSPHGDAINRFTSTKAVLTAISLQKGGNVNLSKEAANLTKVIVSLGWEARSTDGAVFDLDGSVFLLKSDAKVRSDSDFIFYNNLKSIDGSVIHNGNNTTVQGEGDGESMTIDLAGIPAEVEMLSFCVTINEAESRRQNFGMVGKAFIRCMNASGNAEIARYDLSGDNSTETAMIFGELYRASGDWKFRAVGQGFNRGLGPLARSFGVNI